MQIPVSYRLRFPSVFSYMSIPLLSNQRILLGVSGGVAAYKAADLTRRLRDAGAQVRVVLTANAERFVSALTFQALSGEPVRGSLWDDSAEAAMGHIELARWAQHILIAPASANLIARLAHGLADDLLTTLCLASEAPIALAPAMNQQMWANVATQANLCVLRERGAAILGPDSGSQACGEFGAGRLLEPQKIVAELAMLHTPGPMNGTRVLISAGPTYEDIDPVRFIGNRSSGRMGFALAQAAVEQGADVHLVAGPVHLATPPGVARVDVRSAREMQTAVMNQAKRCDIFIAAAAVGDYRPASVAKHKMSKRDGKLNLELEENPDIVAGVAALKPRPFVVGFAAETRQLEERARDKLETKHLDLIAANRVDDGHGFDVPDNEFLLLWADGKQQLPRANKLDLAHALLKRIAELRGTPKPQSRRARK